MMELLPWRYTYHYLLIVTLLVEYGGSVVLSNQTAAVNDSVYFACTVGDVTESVWAWTGLTSAPKQTISSGTKVFRNELMALNITPILYTRNYIYNLLIPVVSVDMGGRYDCSERGNETTIVYLRVEVPPVVRLLIDDVILNGSIDVVVNKEISIQCVADGGMPHVSLRWDVDGSEETRGVNVVISSSQVVTTLNYRPSLEDKIISCTTIGQIAIPSITVQTSLNIMYKPTCWSQFINDNTIFLCSCNANPTASNISIFANGSLYVNHSKTTLPFLYPVDLFCMASNSIGTTQTEAHNFQPNISDNYLSTTIPHSKSTRTPFPFTTVLIPCLVVGILVVCGVLVLTVTLLRRRGKTNKFTVPIQVGNLEAQMWSTMSDRPPRPSPQQRNHISRINAYSYAKEPLNDMIAECASSFAVSDVISTHAVTEGSTYNQMYTSIPSSDSLKCKRAQSGESPGRDLELDKEIWNVDNTMTGDTYHRIQSVVVPNFQSLPDNSQITVLPHHNYQKTEDPTSYNPSLDETSAFDQRQVDTRGAPALGLPSDLRQDDKQFNTSSYDDVPQFKASSWLTSDDASLTKVIYDPISNGSFLEGSKAVAPNAAHLYDDPPTDDEVVFTTPLDAPFI